MLSNFIANYVFCDFNTFMCVNDYLCSVQLTFNITEDTCCYILSTSDSFVMDLIEDYCALNDFHYSMEFYYDVK